MNTLKVFFGKSILVTGAAGFIGSNLCGRLLDGGAHVCGVDNLNDYYDPALKRARLALLEGRDGFTFVCADIADKAALMGIFESHHFDYVVNLAAQAGVRYSITNPDVYISSNVVGFFNILEACRAYVPEHLVFASSSSVYGNQQKVPFSVTDDVSRPISLYAATKKSNELMAYTYSHLFGIPATGVRFFTVYGPFGRPDMAYYSFTRKMLAGEPIKIFNNGDMLRDFTYIDDIISGLFSILAGPPKSDAQGDRYAIYNIGNNSPVRLMSFIETLESALSEAYGREIKAEKEYLPMQPGDVYRTYADIDSLTSDFGFRPSTGIREGLGAFARWYAEYYKE